MKNDVTNVLSAGDFKKELKKLSGGYLFYGEEDYLKHFYLNAVREEVLPEGDFFNHIILNPDTYSPDALMSAVEALPVMSDRKLIEIVGLPLSGFTDGSTDELCEVLERLPSYEYNVLVLYQNNGDFEPLENKKPTKTAKKLAECLRFVRFGKESPARLAAWCSKHFSSRQIISSPETVDLLMNRLGCDMFLLSSEIDKLCWYLKENGRDRLTVEDVMLVSSETREIAAFDFTNAILDRKPDDAFAILNELKLKKERPEILLSGISRVACDLLTVRVLCDGGDNALTVAQKMKIHEYKAKLYIRSAAATDMASLTKLMNACYEADMKIKSSPLDSYVLLDRLAAQAVLR